MVTSNQASSFIHRGMQLANASGSREAVERLRLVLGSIYHKSGRLLAALEQHIHCLNAANAGYVPDPNFRLSVLHNIISDYVALGDMGRARDLCETGLEQIHSLDTLNQQASALCTLAQSYVAQGLYEEARIATSKAFALYEVLNNFKTQALLQTSYGLLLAETDDIALAQEYLQSGASLIERAGGPIERISASAALARLLLQRDDIDSAEQEVEKALAVGQQLGVSDMTPVLAVGLANAIALSGEIASRRNDALTTDRRFEEAIQLLIGDNDWGPSSANLGQAVAEIYRRYAQVLAKRGDYKELAQYFERAYSPLAR